MSTQPSPQWPSTRVVLISVGDRDRKRTVPRCTHRVSDDGLVTGWKCQQEGTIVVRRLGTLATPPYGDRPPSSDSPISPPSRGSIRRAALTLGFALTTRSPRLHQGDSEIWRRRQRQSSPAHQRDRLRQRVPREACARRLGGGAPRTVISERRRLQPDQTRTDVEACRGWSRRGSSGQGRPRCPGRAPGPRGPLSRGKRPRAGR